MASMLVSGKAALHTNSDRHFTASWKESMAAAKCSWKVFTEGKEEQEKTMNWCFLRVGLRVCYLQLSGLWLRTEWWSYSLTMCPVVWKASSTMVSSWSEAAWWNTEKMFFQPDRILAAWEFTIWATHLITMSLMVGDLTGDLHEGVIIMSVKKKLYNNI